MRKELERILWLDNDIKESEKHIMIINNSASNILSVSMDYHNESIPNKEINLRVDIDVIKSLILSKIVDAKNERDYAISAMIKELEGMIDGE